jgi:Arc/MetJ-type ribon-helix-helix transcriptional regulator
MADKVVSVRMPQPLVEELREIAEENHFLDLSEELRHLLRKRWLRHKDPYSYRLDAIRHGIKKEKLPDRVMSLKKDLKRLLEEIDEIEK